MKVCPNCNKVCMDRDAFCTQCGMAFPVAAQSAAEEKPVEETPVYQAAPVEPQIPTYQAPPAEPEAPQAPTYQVPPQYAAYTAQNGEEPVSTGKWVLYQLIPLTPVVGGLVYIVMMFVWAFGQNNNTTFRNWARSQLILAGIGLVIGILALVAVVALGVSLAGMSEFSEGVTEYYSYY